MVRIQPYEEADLRREWYGEELLILSRPGPKRWEVEEPVLVEIEPRAQTGELTVVVDAADHKRTEFFTAHGYKPEESIYQMLIELDQPWLKTKAPPGTACGVCSLTKRMLSSGW